MIIHDLVCHHHSHHSRRGWVYLSHPGRDGRICPPRCAGDHSLPQKYVSGIVLETSDKLPADLEEAKIKPIHDIVSTAPVLTPELMMLLKWISDYYICYLGQAFRLVHSQLNVGKSPLRLRRCLENIPTHLPKDHQQFLTLIPYDREISIQTIRKKVSSSSLNSMITRLEKLGYLQKNYAPPTKKSPLQLRIIIESTGSNTRSFQFKPRHCQNEKSVPGSISYWNFCRIRNGYLTRI